MTPFETRTLWKRFRFRIWLEWKLLTKAGRKEVRSIVKTWTFATAYGAGGGVSAYWITPRVCRLVNYPPVGFPTGRMPRDPIFTDYLTPFGRKRFDISPKEAYEKFQRLTNVDYASIEKKIVITQSIPSKNVDEVILKALKKKKDSGL
jgi:hypothetical protein